MLTIILKATEDCNSNCSYCDVILKKKTLKRMPYEILEIVFNRISEYKIKHNEQQITIVLHGGEPLILGEEYFKKILEIHNKTLSNFGEIYYNIQTNLTLLTETFIEIFKKLGMDCVGTSYDPELNVRGFGKKIDTIKYNKSFIKSLLLLERYKLGWGIIYVVTSKSLKRPIEIFNFLCNLTNNGGFNFNPVLIPNGIDNKLRITPNQFADFLGAIFPKWLENKKILNTTQPFTWIYDFFEGTKKSLSCVDSGDCSKGQINIAPDGEISICGRASDLGILVYGNIKKISFDDVIEMDIIKKLGERKKILQNNDCENCKIFSICNGGCPLDSQEKYNNYMRKTGWCSSRKRFINKYFLPLTGFKIEEIWK